MEFEDVPTMECKSCEGTGEIDPTDYLDMDSVAAITKELIATANHQSEHTGLHAKKRAEQIRIASRISWLAGRLAWLLACEIAAEESGDELPGYAKNVAAERLRGNRDYSAQAMEWAEKHSEQPAAA